MQRTSQSSFCAKSCHCFKRDTTYVQPNTPNTPNLLLCQRAQELADGLLLASWLAGTKHRLAAEHIHLDILAIVSSDTDVNG